MSPSMHNCTLLIRGLPLPCCREFYRYFQVTRLFVCYILLRIVYMCWPAGYLLRLSCLDCH